MLNILTNLAYTIINSFRTEMARNPILSNASKQDVWSWVQLAIRCKYPIGSQFKRIYLIPYGDTITPIFGYDAFRDVVRDQFGLNIEIDVFTKQEIQKYLQLTGEKQLNYLPKCIPISISDKNITSYIDIFAFRIIEVDIKNREVKRVKDLSFSEIFSSEMCKIVDRKVNQFGSFWAKWPLAMARKTALISYIKQAFPFGVNNKLSDMIKNDSTELFQTNENNKEVKGV